MVRFSVEDLGFVSAVVIIGELKKNKPEHRRGILAGFEVRIGTKIIRGVPQIVFELFELLCGHVVFRGRTFLSGAQRSEIDRDLQRGEKISRREEKSRPPHTDCEVV